MSFLGGAGLAEAGKQLGADVVEGMPPWVHAGAALAAAVPPPALLAFALVGTAVYSGAWAMFLQKRYPGLVPWLHTLPYLRHLLPAEGRDAPYVIVYGLTAVSACLALALVSALGPGLPSGVVLGVFVSIAGVAMSVYVDEALMFADPDSVAAAEATAEASTVRRTFLHAPMGAAVAAVVLALAPACPIPTSS